MFVFFHSYLCGCNTIECLDNMKRNAGNLKVQKDYCLFILFFYFFLFKAVFEQKVPILAYSDEAIAMMAIPIGLVHFCNNHGYIRMERYSICVTLLVVLGLVSNLVYKYQPMVQAALPDLLLNLKFWFCIPVGAYAFRKFDIQRYSQGVFNHIRVMTVFYTLLIILDYIHPIFRSEIRYGMRSTQLFYNHPTVFAANCSFLLAILTMIHDNLSLKNRIAYEVWLSLLMCSTLRSKMFGCVMLFWIIVYFVFLRKKRFQLRTLFLFVPLVAAIGWEQVEYYFFSSIQADSARFQLLAKSLMIANDHFPLGSGFGTFASHYSSVEYSPLYEIYEIANISGLQKGNAAFVSDSYWPMVLAQFGWIGLIAMIAALFFLFHSIQRIRNASVSGYAAALFILMYLLIESTSSSAFVHPLSMPLALLLGYLLQNFKDSTLKRYKE